MRLFASLVQCCRVLYTFTARDSSEVSLVEGSMVNVLQRNDLDGNADWWLVVAPDGRTGYAPASYLEPAS
jgi:peroxin-13